LRDWYTGDDPPDDFEPEREPPPRPRGVGPFDPYPESLTARVIEAVKAHDAKKGSEE
jgi:hypothetical protein